MITQEDVARHANVSRALVSLVMRNAPNVSDASRRKVQAAATELGYRPNAYARSLASKQVSTLGVFVNDVTNPYFGALYASLANAASAAGYSILTAPGTRTAELEVSLVNTLLEHRVAGLALLSPLMKVAQLRAITASIPTVVIGRDVSIPGVDVVTTDECAAAEQVIAHLFELGHRDIAHLDGGANRAAKDRAAGYRAAMNARGLRPRVVSGSFSEEGGIRGARALLTDPPLPTAVVAANDLSAVGAIGTLRSAGLPVPEHISVVGYDDSQIARLEVVRLTSVRQAIDGFGTAAVATLLARIAAPGRPRTVQRLATELIERDTVAPARVRRPG